MTEKRKAFEEKLGAQLLRAAGDEAWEDLKKGVEKARDDVKTAVHDAAAKLK